MDEIHRALRVATGKDTHLVQEIPRDSKLHWIHAENISADNLTEVLAAFKKTHEIVRHHYDPKTGVLIAIIAEKIT